MARIKTNPINFSRSDHSLVVAVVVVVVVAEKRWMDGGRSQKPVAGRGQVSYWFGKRPVDGGARGRALGRMGPFAGAAAAGADWSRWTGPESA